MKWIIQDFKQSKAFGDRMEALPPGEEKDRWNAYKAACRAYTTRKLAIALLLAVHALMLSKLAPAYIPEPEPYLTRTVMVLFGIAATIAMTVFVPPGKKAEEREYRRIQAERQRAGA